MAIVGLVITVDQNANLELACSELRACGATLDDGCVARRMPAVLELPLGADKLELACEQLRSIDGVVNVDIAYTYFGEADAQ